MKTFQLIAAAATATVLATSALAAPVTFAFEATRTSSEGTTTPAGTATEFAISPDGAAVTGTFTYDPDGVPTTEQNFPDVTAYFFAGPASITLNGVGGTTFTADQPNGDNTTFLFDAAPGGSSSFSDGFGVELLSPTDRMLIDLRSDSNTLFSSDQLPMSLDLDDFSSAGFFINNLNEPFASARYDISALTLVEPSAVPLPASSLLLIGGLGGLAALRRRKRAA